PGVAIPRIVESVRSGPKGPLVKLLGIDSIDDAEMLRGRSVTLLESELPGEWLEVAFDPCGMSIIDDERGHLGAVVETIVTGANDVWVVRNESGREVLLPVIDDVVIDIDEKGDLIRVRLLPGLMPDEE
ncbi:MAG: hypothetical protein U1E22_04150, partial [Coriobacteriia bacterium]|nr:hypothetical protein [Coriobacteriia bacterium]